MKSRPLGRSGLQISEIGFGCGTGAALMIDGAPADQRAAVARALDLGVTYFDTAPIYGATRSETNLGRTLRELDASPVVGTKVALDLGDLDDIAGATARSIAASIERLGREPLDVVFLHNRVARARAEKADIGVGALLTVDDVLGPNGVLEGLRRARERGHVRAFGCCAYGGEAAAVDAVIASDAFDALLVHYSLLNETAFEPPFDGTQRDYEQVARRAAEHGVSSVALRVLEAGQLAQSPRLVSTAIRFALARPAVATVLIGVSAVAHIEAAVAAADLGPLPR
jgi:aryl-alcohol dehydrogenase-like predicted oxidoreductase